MEIGAIYSEQIAKGLSLYRCKDGTFSDKQNGCNYHGGVIDKTPYLVSLNCGGGKVVTSKAGVFMLPLSSVKTDVSLFQNRLTDYSAESTSNIVTDAKNGAFEWSIFDPITVWQPVAQKEEFIVLSGHSRFKAFNDLAKSGVKADGKGFGHIPSKIFAGTKEEAVKIALTSNSRAGQETERERARYYRNLRATGKDESEIREEAKRLERSNANRVLKLSYLNPKGFLLDSMEQLKGKDRATANTLSTVAEWIGKAREKFPQLTDQHETELTNWLITHGAYGVTAGKIRKQSDFLEKVKQAIDKKTDFGVFVENEPLNMVKAVKKNTGELAYQETLKELQKELSTAKAITAKKDISFTEALDKKKITREKYGQLLAPFKEAEKRIYRKLLAHSQKEGNYRKAGRSQASLFGIGRIGKIAQPSGESLTLHQNGDTQDIINALLLADSKSSGYVEEFAKRYRGKQAKQIGLELWHWLRKNINYELDPMGKQILQSPGQLYKSKKGDCKSLSIFTGAVLRALKIPYVYRFAAYKNGDVTHVYTVANPQTNPVIIDAVWTKPLSEKRYKYKKDIMPKISYIGSTGKTTLTARDFGLEENGISVDLGEGDLSELTEGQMDGFLEAERLQTNAGIAKSLGDAQSQMRFEGEYLATLYALRESGATVNAPDLDTISGYGIGGLGDWLKRAGKNIGKAAKKVAGTVTRVLSAPARLVIKGILEVLLPKAAPLFIYLYAPSSLKMSAKGQRKKRKAEKLKKFIVDKIKMKSDHFDKIVKRGIQKRFGYTPEQVFKSGRVNGIGALPLLAAVATSSGEQKKDILGALFSLIQKIASIFKSQPPESVGEEDLPEMDDFIFEDSNINPLTGQPFAQTSSFSAGPGGGSSTAGGMSNEMKIGLGVGVLALGYFAMKK